MDEKSLREFNKKLDEALFVKKVKQIIFKIIKEVQTQGDKGDKGEKGDQGKNGKDGIMGPKGEKGDIGPQGDKGEKGDQGKNGKEGKNGKDGKNGKQGKVGDPGPKGDKGEKGDPGPKGEDGSIDTGKDIIKKINKLPLTPDFMIDASHVKNLTSPIIFTSSGKRVKGRQVRDDLSSQCDGSNKTFILSKNFVPNTVQLFSTQFPIIYRPVIDFSEDSSGTLTLTSEVGAPASGQTLVALYEKYI